MATWRTLFWTAFLFFAPGIYASGTAKGEHYLGPETCALCHRQIAQTQSQTAMANTWQTGRTAWLARDFSARFTDGPDPAILSEVRRLADTFRSTVTLPGHPAQTVPVEAMVGGKRHGIGFLIRVPSIDGVPLSRPLLVQARYAWSVREQKLVLAPGCPEAKPANYKTAFGLPLSPEYERRCLECHGQPHTLGAGPTGGVQCEACHGPGEKHLQGIAKGTPHLSIVNPARLDAEAGIAVCARCHVGLTKFSDPEPEDLLVANQVVALKTSECFLQSRKGLTCTTCHNPHEDVANLEAVSQRACLQCHSLEAKPHAAVCPVNAQNGCVGCHMPSREIGPFHLVDHLIRVHPENKTVATPKVPALASQLSPVSEFLERTDISSQGDGIATTYLGRKNLADLGPTLGQVAAKLGFGERSTPVALEGSTVVLRRMPRDFQEKAARLTDSAEIRLTRGDLNGAIAQGEAALSTYPASLKAMVVIGRALGQKGDFNGATAMLERAVKFYPNDAGAAYHLARSLGRQGRSADAITEYRRAIASDGDFVPPYLNLGNALRVLGNTSEAERIFRAGLQVDPLAAELYRALGAILSAEGNRNEAEKMLATADEIEGVSRK